MYILSRRLVLQEMYIKLGMIVMAFRPVSQKLEMFVAVKSGTMCTRMTLTQKATDLNLEQTHQTA